MWLGLPICLHKSAKEVVTPVLIRTAETMATSGKKLFTGIQFSKGNITLEHGQKSLPP